jgi:2-alkyl-3-oxoalkanoate reductase
MRVFVAGATGAVGRPLLRLLQDAGHVPVAMTRSEESAASLREDGVEAVVADALERHDVVAAVAGSGAGAIVHQLTSIPSALNPRNVDKQFKQTNRLRTEGTRNLLEAAREAGISRFVAQSVAFVYEHEGDWVKDENAPLYRQAPKGYTETLSAVMELERLVSGAGGTVLRYGFFYGPGTAYAAGGQVVELIRKRRYPLVGDAQARHSFVHVEDAARAVVAALEAGPGVYNIVDDDPAVVREWLPEVAELVGARPPRRVPAWVARLAAGEYGVVFMTRLRGASNARARSELPWEPTRRSWREGFRAELADGPP